MRRKVSEWTLELEQLWASTEFDEKKCEWVDIWVETGMSEYRVGWEEIWVGRQLS